MRRVGMLVAISAALVAVSSCAKPNGLSTEKGSPDATTPSGSDPSALCRRALPGHLVVSATWTTVGEVRSWGYGGPVQKRPLSAAFASAAPGDQAAWCWTRESRESYTAWAVRAPADAVRAITVNGPTEVTPAGPPRIP